MGIRELRQRRLKENEEQARLAEEKIKNVFKKFLDGEDFKKTVNSAIDNILESVNNRPDLRHKALVTSGVGSMDTLVTEVLTEMIDEIIKDRGFYDELRSDFVTRRCMHTGDSWYIEIEERWV